MCVLAYRDTGASPPPSTCQRAIYADSSTQAVSHTFPADASAVPRVSNEVLLLGLCLFVYITHNLCVFFFISRGLSVDKTWPFQSAPGLFLRVSIELSIGGAALSTSPSRHIFVN
jgi:hypothetical protein